MKGHITQRSKGSWAIVIDADAIGREVVEQSPTLRKKLIKTFGEEIVDTRGHIRRRRLAALARAFP